MKYDIVCNLNTGLIEETLDILIIVPLDFSRYGIERWTNRMTERKKPKLLSKCSKMFLSLMLWTEVVKALFTRISKRPNSLIVVSISLWTSSSFFKSAKISSGFQKRNSFWFWVTKFKINKFILWVLVAIILSLLRQPF